MRRNLFLLILIAAAMLGVFYYAVKSSRPRAWENSAFVAGCLYGNIY